MHGQIEWVLIMDIGEGQSHAVQPLTDEMVAATSSDEAGALVYEYFLNSEKSRYTVMERYKDTDTAMVHLDNFCKKFADRFFSLFVQVSFTVFGPAGAPLREALSDFGATFEDRIGGFAR